MSISSCMIIMRGRLFTARKWDKQHLISLSLWVFFFPTSWVDKDWGSTTIPECDLDIQFLHVVGSGNLNFGRLFTLGPISRGYWTFLENKHVATACNGLVYFHFLLSWNTLLSRQGKRHEKCRELRWEVCKVLAQLSPLNFPVMSVSVAPQETGQPIGNCEF